MIVDEGSLPEWPQEVLAALDIFDQGDLVPSPPFFYAAMPSVATWSATELMASEVPEGEDIVIELDPDDRPPFGIITSQGCDVADTTRKPWVQVAPVYEGSAEEQIADIRRDAISHLVLLDPPELEGVWVADLRLEVPIEKSWLSGRMPIPGFSDSEGRRRFANRLSGRLERPALPDQVHETIVRPLRRWLDRCGSGMRRALSEAGVEFRLNASEHSGSDRIVCRLLVVGRRHPVPQQVIDALNQLWATLSETSVPGVALLGLRFATSDEVTMREYLASVLLDDRFLGDVAA